MMLYIVRHAWAGEPGDPRFVDDNLRPLTDSGKKRFERMAKKLVKRDFAPQAIATSPLVRTRQTADILADVCIEPPTISVLEDLAPGGQIGPLIDWTRGQAPVDVAWVGHAPDVEHLAATLIGGSRAQIAFAKGAVAAIRFADKVSEGTGELVWLATAELLRV